MKRNDHTLEPLDAILRRATAQAPSPPTPECADFETLAAYYDRSLAEPDRERLEAHFADCARCQAQLAAIARADEAATSARSQLGVSWLRPRLQIVIPAFAAAAALLIVVRATRLSHDESRRNDQVAMAKHQASLMDLAARTREPVSPPAGATAPNAPATNELAMNEAKPAEPPAAKHRQVLEHRDQLRERAIPLAKKPHLPESAGEEIARAPSRRSSSDVAGNEAAQVNEPPVSAPARAGAISPPIQAGSAETAALSQQAPAAAAPAPDTMSESAAAPRALARSASSLAATNSGARGMSSAAPVGSGAATGAVGGAAIGAGAGASQLHMEQATSAYAGAAISIATGAIVGSTMPKAGAAPEVLAMISPPDQKAAWIVGKNGMIMRREPDGTTHPQHSGVSTDLTAGAAPSATVCWVVGRSGTIIRTTDGEHWVLITPPTGDNLVAVASDRADHAIVTTASGLNFETSDGGASWHRD